MKKEYSVTEYAKLKGVSRAAIKMQIKRGTIKDKVKVIGTQYVIESDSNKTIQS